MIAVAVASESLLAGLDANRQRLATLEDPRIIHLDDGQADTVIAAHQHRSTTSPARIHSPESGAPSALAELAYRLAVDEAPTSRTSAIT